MSLHARCHAREYLASSGLSIEDLDREDFRLLVRHLNRSIRSTSEDMRDIKVGGRIRIVGIGGRRIVEIRCSSDYFDNREAVTFNRDGFVGICGWADRKNSLAFTRGFCSWVDDLAPDFWPSRASEVISRLSEKVRSGQSGMTATGAQGDGTEEILLANLVRKIETKAGEEDPPVWLHQDRITDIVRKFLSPAAMPTGHS